MTGHVRGGKYTKLTENISTVDEGAKEASQPARDGDKPTR
jgi:hypothetical protein